LDCPTPSVSPRLPSLFAPSLVASALLGLAVLPSGGRINPVAVALVGGALAVLSWRFIASMRGAATFTLPTTVTAIGVFATLLAFLIIAILHEHLIYYPKHSWAVGRISQILSVAWLCTYLPGIDGGRGETTWLRDLRFAGWALLVGLSAAGVLHASPEPTIDVWTIQQRGVEALAAGTNPYTTAFVPHTGPDGSCEAPVPYVYPPTQLLLTLPSHLLGGDVRYTMVAALLMAGLALRSIVRCSGRPLPAILEDAPTLFLWLTPMFANVVENAWIDPVQLALVALTFAAHVHRRPWWTAILLGLLLSAKQSMFWLAPLAIFMLGLPFRTWPLVTAAALAPVLPFAAWDPVALRYANFDFLSALPPRDDALTFLNALQRGTGIALPGAIGFALTALVVGAASLRLRERTSVFGLAACLTYLVFFSFNKWAFANYYFLLAGLGALSAAASLHENGAGDASVDAEDSR